MLGDIVFQIESFRELQHISKAKLCAAADITPQYYHLITTGAATGVAFNIIVALCNAVNLSVLLTVEVDSVKKILNK